MIRAQILATRKKKGYQDDFRILTIKNGNSSKMDTITNK